MGFRLVAVALAGGELVAAAQFVTVGNVGDGERVVGEGIAAAVAADEDLGAKFEGVQGIAMHEFFDTAYWC